ncbi:MULTISPECIES: hypothetical protein [Prochlorococcus]|nr:hypothetical protein [Prochlorococcus marinus]
MQNHSLILVLLQIISGQEIFKITTNMIMKIQLFFLGDSFIDGSGYNNDDDMTDLIQNSIKEKLSF